MTNLLATLVLCLSPTPARAAPDVIFEHSSSTKAVGGALGGTFKTGVSTTTSQQALATALVDILGFGLEALSAFASPPNTIDGVNGGARFHGDLKVQANPTVFIPFSQSSLSVVLQMDAIATGFEELRLFGDLVDYLREHPQALSLLSGLLSPEDISRGPLSPLFKMAVGALATLGTSEAQAELLTLYRDPDCPVTGKGTVLSALTTTQAELNPSTREFLLQESHSPERDLSWGALWALGSSLQKSQDPVSKQEIRAIAQDRTDALLSDQERKLAVLDAMGNSGRPEFFPTLSAEINGTDPVLRAKAIFALRFIATPEATGLLASELASPADADRLAAASAIQAVIWNPAFLAPVQACAANEHVQQIQSTCKYVAAHHAPPER